ncbi:MAG: thiamine pyrophosphate-dependent enzyme [Desulfobacula sp.]|jgi:indolepyruvate ferredoxin oxidoreductase alpha subunit|nr:thiamine pyrophosphate-dependent enzyme [Desulfobacula sp.]
MTVFQKKLLNTQQFLMGNHAIARGALEAGVQFATGYPGTPSSEIIQNIAEAAKTLNVYAEWSINEKVASETAGAAAIAGLRSLSAMKNAGLSVALDFLTHLSYSGLGDGGGAMVNIVCDDPDAHSSGDETDSRWLAKFAHSPLLEPSTIQEAKEMIQWAFDLSEKYKSLVFFRGYTRLSHASGMVEMGDLPEFDARAQLDLPIPLTPYLARPKHAALIEKLALIKQEFELAPFNSYTGPDQPELIVLCSGSALYCSQEAIELLDLADQVGILKIATLWPFPAETVLKHLNRADKILVAEEVDPFVEQHLKSALVDAQVTGKTIYGKDSGHIPLHGEITPDRIIKALAGILSMDHSPRSQSYESDVTQALNDHMIQRGLTWCAGCPHRASFWAIEKAVKQDKQNACITGDIGCYTLDIFPGGKGRIDLLHAMGSGAGLAGGLGQLKRFGQDRPVISICGDSTFFHASIPALVNAVHNQSNMIQIVLDNSTTAMTGFQSHPGNDLNVVGNKAMSIDIEALCRSLGCTVTLSDPFDLRGTTKIIRNLLKEDKGVRVLILRRHCEIARMKKEKTTPFSMALDQELCKGIECGICSREFRCPALILDTKTGKSLIKEDICSGCGVCVDICPFNAINREV